MASEDPIYDDDVATIEDVETGRREDIECRYLAGCDGARGMVRQHLGFSYQGETPAEQAYGSGATVSSQIGTDSGRNLRSTARERPGVRAIPIVPTGPSPSSSRKNT